LPRILIFLSLLFLLNYGFAQDGRLLSKKEIDISTTDLWDKISQNDKLNSNLEHLNELNFYSITYQSDKLKVKGLIIEPKKEGKYPVVIFNRGGNRNFAPLNLGTLLLYTSKLAQEGYVIIGSNYREDDEFGGSDIKDVLNLTETIKEIDKANSDLIGMFGWSRGGMMTYLALKKSDQIKTAIVGNGPTNLFQLLEDRPLFEKVFKECIPDYQANKDHELKARSVIFWPDKLNKDSSLLILAGTSDKRVNFNQARDLGKKLNDLDYDYELRLFDTNHIFQKKKEELNKVVISWFNKKLKES
jgi:dipeptidyl aminopeptidase/acylaminoacyl peptidase